MAKRVALALGSGGARGYAYIGVIDELHSRGYEIVGVAGSSMGALVGGLLAAGSLDEFAAWAGTLNQRAMLRLLDPSISAAGVLRAGKILDAVRDILGEVTIESLPIPYTAVATDLIAGKSVWLQHGPVDEAIRASIAIPGMIAPHVLDGRLLADGGILDPVPIAPIAAVNADLTIAVCVSGMETEISVDDNAGAEPSATRERVNRWLRNTSSMLERFSALPDDGVADSASPDGAEPDATEPDAPGARAAESGAHEAGGPGSAPAARDTPGPRLGSFAVMNRSFDIAQAALARHQMAAYPPDLVIEVPRTACRSLDFHRAAEVIDLGHELAARALDRVEGRGES